MNKPLFSFALALLAFGLTACPSSETNPTPTDTAAPSVTIQSPQNASSTAASSLTVSGIASDNTAVTSLQYSLNGAPRVNATGTSNWSFTVAGLVSGSNTVTVYAKDASGNEGSSSVSVTYTAATSNPNPTSYVLIVNKSGNGSVTSIPSGIACGADCTESYASGTGVTLSATPDSGNGFTGWSGACSGTSSTCTLLMSQIQTVSATFSATTPPPNTDTTAPTLTISSPLTNTSTDASSITVSGTAADAVGVTQVQYSLSGAAKVAVTGTTAWSFSVTLNIGSNVVQVYAKDAAGNERPESIVVTRTNSVDTTAPTNQLSSQPATNTDELNITLSGSASDAGGISAVQYTINGGARLTATGTTAWSLNAALSVGLNTIVIYARDSSGNETPITVTITRNGGSYTLAPVYPSGSSSFVIAQGADALYYFTLSSITPFNTPASALSSLTASGTVIGAAANQLKVLYRTDLSSASQAAIVIKAGSSAPLGLQTITINSSAGGVTMTPITITVNVVACSSGC